jgi:hypothetical protein
MTVVRKFVVRRPRTSMKHQEQRRGRLQKRNNRRRTKKGKTEKKNEGCTTKLFVDPHKTKLAHT